MLQSTPNRSAGAPRAQVSNSRNHLGQISVLQRGSFYPRISLPGIARAIRTLLETPSTLLLLCVEGNGRVSWNLEPQLVS